MNDFCNVYSWCPKCSKVLEPQIRRFLETMTQTPMFTSWLGLICHDVSFPDLSCFYPMTIFQKKTNRISCLSRHAHAQCTWMVMWYTLVWTEIISHTELKYSSGWRSFSFWNAVLNLKRLNVVLACVSVNCSERSCRKTSTHSFREKYGHLTCMVYVYWMYT